MSPLTLSTPAADSERRCKGPDFSSMSDGASGSSAMIAEELPNPDFLADANLHCHDMISDRECNPKLSSMH